MLGQISLNISCLLYTLLYIPQVMHNHKNPHLETLSLSMHVVLYAAYCLDILYGVVSHLPWQYLLVALSGCLLVSMQHLQLYPYYHDKKPYQLANRVLAGGMMLGGGYLCSGRADTLWLNHLFGYGAQLGFSLAMLPQLIKSQQHRSAIALNRTYLVIGLLLAVLDLLSAWSLNWGWPNKLGSMVILVLNSIAYWQSHYYLLKRVKEQTI